MSIQFTKISCFQNEKKELGLWVVVCLWLVLTACENDTEKNMVVPQPGQETPQATIGETVLHPVTEVTRETYQWYCTQCHGVEGKGDGINSKYVTVPPRNHTKSDYLETRSDQELFDAIRLGGLKVGRAPCMPPWGHTLDEKMIWSLVRYIRELCHCEAI